MTAYSSNVCNAVCVKHKLRYGVNIVVFVLDVFASFHCCAAVSKDHYTACL